jgi:hypothetical protein
MRVRFLVKVSLPATLLCCATFLAACGPSGTPQASRATAQGCLDVSAVLSDGPDPGFDPVGYAQAQILPLTQVDTSDRALHAAIVALDGAYRRAFSTNDAPGAAQAVAKASIRLDAICPGAAPAWKS